MNSRTVNPDAVALLGLQAVRHLLQLCEAAEGVVHEARREGDEVPETVRVRLAALDAAIQALLVPQWQEIGDDPNWWVCSGCGARIQHVGEPWQTCACRELCPCVGGRWIASVEVGP